MKDRLATFALIIGAAVFVAAISYGFARAGEPQSLWLWRDVLGLVQ